MILAVPEGREFVLINIPSHCEVRRINGELKCVVERDRAPRKGEENREGMREGREGKNFPIDC